MELKDIQNLIKFVAKSGASEVKLEMEDVKITIKTGSDEKETIVQHMQMPAQIPQQPRLLHQLILIMEMTLSILL